MRFAPLALAALLALPVAAQNSPEAAVQATITQLFDGMRAKDTTAIRATMHPEARLMTTVNRDGQRAVQESPISQFLASVAGAPVELDEQIPDDYPVMVDDGLAVAWVPYAFYAGGQFSHCGTNAFLLALGESGWQVVQIMDTRRRECDSE
jgi:hypothetical protein